MLAAGNASRPPLSQIYVIVNSKLGPEFKMPDRNIPGVLGRSIGVALTSALRAEIETRLAKSRNPFKTAEVFLVDEEGKIEVAQYNVRATGHVAKLRRDLSV